MRKQLCERDLIFAGVRKFRPELGYVAIKFDIALLENMQQARTPQALCRRPNQDSGVGRPGLLSFRVSKSAMQFENRFPILPNGNRSTELPKPLEVFLEKRSDSTELHCRA